MHFRKLLRIKKIYKFLHTVSLIRAKIEKKKLKRMLETQKRKQKEPEEKKKLMNTEFKKISKNLKYETRERTRTIKRRKK